MIASRALMGAAAACVMPPALSLVAVLFPPELRPKAAGIWSAVGGLGWRSDRSSAVPSSTSRAGAGSSS